MKKIYTKPLTDLVRVCAEPLMQSLSKNITGNRQDLDDMKTNIDLGIEIGDDQKPGDGFEYIKPNITDIWADEEDW